MVVLSVLSLRGMWRHQSEQVVPYRALATLIPSYIIRCRGLGSGCLKIFESINKLTLRMIELLSAIKNKHSNILTVSPLVHTTLAIGLNPLTRDYIIYCTNWQHF